MSDSSTATVVTVVGARPQFIKAAPVSRAIIRSNQSAANRIHIREIMLHSGQHYDHNMSDIFFEQLGLAKPDYQLTLRGTRHGEMTGAMLADIETVLLKEKPQALIVYGDTNTTLAAALAASKLHIPIAHIEAGLRSFNRNMPEEINRVLTDHISTALYCPTQTAVTNLQAEGISKGVKCVGDVMFDATLLYREQALNQVQQVLDRHTITADFGLVTFHRAENTDDPERLRQICAALAELSQRQQLVFPMHPRTAKAVRAAGLEHQLQHCVVLEPVPYLEMLGLLNRAKFILTDSGGIQKEAYFCKTPCITMRDETEWLETLRDGANRLVGASQQKIIQAVENAAWNDNIKIQGYGDGQAADEIVTDLAGYL